MIKKQKQHNKDFLVFENISKSFGSQKVLNNVNLTIPKGEVFTLLGPSGCGKTTLLRICAGFETPDTGRVLLNGVDITELPPNRRQVNTVFQNYALFPNMTVEENIAFGPKLSKWSPKKIEKEIDFFLDLIQMSSHRDKKPNQLSGGQKQRVAIARALINKPLVLALDEPLAALDLKLRQRMLVELDDIHDQIGTTFLFVTHDQSEAMSISNQIAVMDDGKIRQIGSPIEIYEAPKTSFVAAFIGDTNFFEGIVTKVFDEEFSKITVDGFPDILIYNDKKVKKGSEVYLSVRPEKINITRNKPTDKNPWLNNIKGIVEDVVYLGPQTKFWVKVGDFRIAVYKQHKTYLLDEKPIIWEDEVWLSWNAEYGYLLDKYTEDDLDFLSMPT
ncbi:MAG TPA: ABC transporter ATP-binding protein [Victivallales bacterium]|nr:ABC transporter ATP-binding protein [Victivallales bacterium]